MSKTEVAASIFAQGRVNVLYVSKTETVVSVDVQYACFFVVNKKKLKAKKQLNS